MEAHVRLRNSGCSTVRPTTPLVALVSQGMSLLTCHRLQRRPSSSSCGVRCGMGAQRVAGAHLHTGARARQPPAGHARAHLVPGLWRSSSFSPTSEMALPVSSGKTQSCLKVQHLSRQACIQPGQPSGADLLDLADGFLPLQAAPHRGRRRTCLPGSTGCPIVGTGTHKWPRGRCRSHIWSIPTHKRQGQGIYGVRVPRSTVRCSLASRRPWFSAH